MPRTDIARNVLVSFGIKIGTAGLTFLMFMYLARVLGPEGYGRFATMFGIAGFLTYVALFGQHTLALRWLSTSRRHKDLGRARWILRTGVLTTFAGGLFTWTALVLGALVLRVFRPHTNATAIMLAGTLVLPMAFAELIMAVLRAYGSVAKALLPRDILWRGLVIIVLLVMFQLRGNNVPVIEAFLTTATLLSVLVGIQIYWVYRKLPQAMAFATKAADWSSWRRSSLWCWLAAISGMMAGQLAVVIVAGVLPNLETGAFFAAQKVAQLLQLPLIAINIVAAPLIAQHFHKDDAEGMQRLCYKIILALSLPVAAGFAVLVVFGPWLLGLFDSTYTIAQPALVVLGVAAIIHSLSGPTGTVMLMTSGERSAVIVTFLTEGVGLLLIPPLALTWGITGAAIAAAIGTIGWNLLAILWCRRNIHVDPSLAGFIWRPHANHCQDLVG